MVTGTEISLPREVKCLPINHVQFYLGRLSLDGMSKRLNVSLYNYPDIF